MNPELGDAITPRERGQREGRGDENQPSSRFEVRWKSKEKKGKSDELWPTRVSEFDQSKLTSLPPSFYPSTVSSSPPLQPFLLLLHLQPTWMDLDLSWLQLVRLPPLRYDEDGEETDDPNGIEAPPPPFLSDASRLIKLAGVKIGYIECYVLRRDEMVDRESLHLSFSSFSRSQRTSLFSFLLAPTSLPSTRSLPLTLFALQRES